ncbi:MAG: hybrid sensor histidine kinase/response regulator [Bacteroidales bacterium]|nr:hybrid sensor histidine kinase/response regulator [Bacteroidales bacterium]
MIAAVSCAGPGTRTETLSTAGEDRTVSDRISNLRITSFAEDSLGHIWIGTFRGLNKYNSYEYTQYFCTEGEKKLPDNLINSLFCDSCGRLWVSTSAGICLYTETDSFRRIPSEPDVATAMACHQILEDREGRIFMYNYNSLSMYDPGEDRFVLLETGLDPQLSFVGSAYVDHEDNLWVVGSSCLRRYDPSLRGPADSIALKGALTASCIQDGCRIWLVGKGYMQIFDAHTRRFTDAPLCLRYHPRLSSANVSLIYPYAGGLLFSTENDGLFYYDRSSDTVYAENERGFPFEAPGFVVTAMFTDSHGNLWMGSVDRGYKVSYSVRSKFNNDRPLCAAFEGKSVISVQTDPQGRLWIATFPDGLWVYDLGNDRVTKVEAPIEHDADYEHYPWKNHLFVGGGGAVWLITGKDKVLKCRYAGERLNVERTYDVKGARSIVQDSDGTLWLLCNNSTIYSKRRGEPEFTAHEAFSDGYTFVADLEECGDGRLLAAAFGRPLALIDASSGEVRPARVVQENFDACITHSVFIPTDLFLDSRGEVWIGTTGNGLLRYSPSDGSVEHMEGLSCTDVCGIQEDLYGNIWVSTLHGLCEYSHSSGQFVNWFSYDGTGGDQYYTRASCVLPDGTLVFGGTHGLTVFDPKDVNVRRTVSVVFEDLKVYNRLVSPGDDGIIDRAMSLNPTVRLKHSQNGFGIFFSALNFDEFRRIRYSYRLEGFDNYWIDAGDSHEAYYANLPAGRYTFRVRATDNDKSVESSENSIFIRVRPMPAGSWWAITIYILTWLMIGFTIYFLIRRSRKARKVVIEARAEKERERRLNEMNMSFFSNISHEFRTPLSLISGPVSQLCADPTVKEDNRKLLVIVRRNVDRMLRLVNQLLDFNKLENDTLKLKARRTDIIAEMRQHTETYRIWCAEKDITLASYGFEDTFLMYLDSDNLDKIVSNLMSNAIKYTPSGGRI